MANIAVTAQLPGRALDLLRARHEVRVHTGPTMLRAEEVAEWAAGSHALITLLANPAGAEVMDRCPALRVIGNCAAGFDNVDCVEAERRGIWVTNTPDVLTEATADLTWALILAVTRRVVEADAFLRAGLFKGWELDLMTGSGLQGRTLGILGFGRIGRAVARRATAFGMRVMATATSKPIQGFGDLVFADVEALVASSDVLSLHCPLNHETRGLMDEARLRRMRRGAFLINTARGPVVDEAALVRVLEDGHLGGVGLDVFAQEPVVHPGLMGREDTVLLPHIGSATREARSEMAELAAQNVLAVLAGDEPPSIVVRGR
ncbi:MAG: D-glycerate dehydrogenase [Acidobacteriota bacterium]